MVNEIRSNILSELSEDFNEKQLREIDFAVAKALQGYKVEKDETLPVPLSEPRPLYIREFLARKKMKGCSEGTIYQYEMVLDQFTAWAAKSLPEMSDLDILIYLDYVQTTRKVSNCTLDHIRLVLSSFYSFLHDSGKIARNPMKNIDPIKHTSKVREPLSGMEMERIRGACDTLKEKAVIEVLYSTGGRVSEIVRMNRTDIDNNRIIITGKGDKERFVFFSARAMYAIQKYLDSRNDDNVALFVRNNYPCSRITKSGIEYIVKQVGERANLSRPLFPHLFRHTFATDMLAGGAPINEVSRILGHENLKTTQLYAKESVDDLAISHKKHIA